MDLDLNQEPLQAQSLIREGDPPADRRFVVELEGNHGRIEERIRLLESVVARARDRPHPIQPPNPTLISSSTLYSSERNMISTSIPQPKPQCDRIKPSKTDGGIHLLAEALAMDSSSEQTLPSTSSTSTPVFQPKSGGSVFDCNVCFSLCKDPVLTCCGHLFCWACFYCLPNCDNYASKECPVCEGEVLETDITPIYGAAATPSDDCPIVPIASSSSFNHPTNVIKIPPRPRARRIDSPRQRLPPQQRGTRIFVHPSLLANPSALAQVARMGIIPPPPPSPNPSPFASLSQSLAEHVGSHVNRQPLVSHVGTYFDTGDSIPVNVVAMEQDFPDYIPLYPPPLPQSTRTMDRINNEMNTMASLYMSPPRHQAESSVGNPVSAESNNGFQTSEPRFSSSRRRSANDNGLNLRNWRRRRDS